MTNEQLYAKFSQLKEKESTDNDFEVADLEGMTHKIGVSKEKYPKFFIRTSDTRAAMPNVALELLTVEYNTPCHFVDKQGAVKHFYSIITLLSHDEDLQREFTDIMLMLIQKLGNTPPQCAIAREIQTLIALFEALHCPPRKKVQGLFAELLVIDHSADPETLINAWHTEPSAKYDFTLGPDKIEVKSTSMEVRKHKFFLDQLNLTPHSRLLIASTIVRESGHGNDGLSVDELRDRICNRLTSAEAKTHLFLVVAKTLGIDFAKARKLYFDYAEASGSLKFYDFRNIPAIDKDDVPRGVSEVKFVSDLTHVPDIEAMPLSGDESPLFKAIS